MMTSGRAWRVITVAALLVLPASAHAYTGPGLGMGALSVALGVLGSIFLGIVAVIWYPIKRVLRKLRSQRTRTSTSDELPPE